MDKQRHKLYMAQILSLIFKDKDLCNVIGFKGGTALMFFHNLPRFSTNLDFNLSITGGQTLCEHDCGTVRCPPMSSPEPTVEHSLSTTFRCIMQAIWTIGLIP